jgi:hypothetical protein
MGGLVRSLMLVVLAVSVASGLAASASRSDASEAKGPPPDPPSNGGTSAEVSPDPYFRVVDNAAEGRFSAPGWERRPAGDLGTYGGDYASADPSAGAARFRVEIPKDDHYSVYARWPAGEDNASGVRFVIPTASGAKSDEVDQGLDGGFWVRIGAYEMEKGDRFLQVSGNPAREGRVVADAVMVVRDVLVGRDGRTASYANPDELAPDYSGVAAAAGEPALRMRTRDESTRDESTVRQDVVRRAKGHLGTPYGYDPCRANVQEDCSCLTKLVYEHFGRKFPDSPVWQWRMEDGKKILRKSTLRRGDLVFHDLNRDGRLDDHYKDHVSIWAGNGNIVHASSYFDRVVTSEEKYLGGFWGGKSFKLPPEGELLPEEELPPGEELPPEEGVGSGPGSNLLPGRPDGNKPTNG